MENLKKKIEEIELKIFIYSDRDQIRTDKLKKDLAALNMMLLELMTSEVRQ